VADRPEAGQDPVPIILRPKFKPRPPGMKLPDDAEFWRDFFHEYGYPKKALIGSTGDFDLGGLSSKDLADVTQAYRDTLREGLKDRSWLAVTREKMQRQMVIDRAPKWLGGGRLAALDGQLSLFQAQLPVQLRAAVRGLDPAIKGLLTPLEAKGIKSYVETFKGIIPDDLQKTIPAAIGKRLQDIKGIVPARVQELMASTVSKKALELGMLGLHTLNPSAFKELVRIRDGVLDRLVTPGREWMTRASRIFTEGISGVVKGVEAYKLFQSTGRLLKELEAGLSGFGYTLTPWGRNPIFRITRAGRTLRGYWSATDFIDPIVSRRWWVHIRKDSLGAGVRVLSIPKVRAALSDTVGELSKHVVKSISTVRKLLNNIHPEQLVKNAYDAVRLPFRRTLRRAFGPTIPTMQRFSALASVGGKLLTLLSVRDFLTGKDRLSFPAGLILPGPFAIAFAIGRWIFGRKKAKRKRRRAEAAWRAEQERLKKVYADAAKKRYAYIRKVQRGVLKGRQRRFSRINALLVRLGVRP